MDFLQYYGREFPYQASYISVLQGGIFPKDAKGWVREAHPEALAIESPLDPGAWLRRRVSVMLMAVPRKGRGATVSEDWPDSRGVRCRV